MPSSGTILRRSRRPLALEREHSYVPSPPTPESNYGREHRVRFLSRR